MIDQVDATFLASLQVSAVTWRSLKSILAVFAWLVFPIIPALLAQLNYGMLSFGGADPRDWDWGLWLFNASPLFGFGFLAGVTAGIPDVPGRRWWKALVTSRSAWVAVGPWIGFVLWVSVVYLLDHATWLAERMFGPSRLTSLQPLVPNLIKATLLLTLPYGWLIVAVAAVRRANRVGQMWQAIRRGIIMALAFLGSLFGAFWTATELWRSYFFDPALARAIIIGALCLTVLSGCGNVTVGELRRRELFDAMLTAWVIGLALTWRWWGRPRSRKGSS